MKTPHQIINESGYPLQLFLEEEINNPQSKHGWKVFVKEHRWVNSITQDEGYIDLVLEHNSYIIRLIIECKRVSGSWTFLLPSNNPSLVTRGKLLTAKYPGSTLFTWTDLKIIPESCEAQFCVMEVEGKKDSRTLEKLSGELLLSLESLAVEEVKLLSKLSPYEHEKRYLPIIVTTANLQICMFDPKNISPEDGSITTEGDMRAVDFIRFRKNLAGNPEFQQQNFDTLTKANRENERSVFVVQAKSITSFLEKLRF
jgi:hypothetical protein